MCMCMCVSTLKAIKNHSIEMNQSNKFYCFSVFYMMLAVDITDGDGLTNETRCEFLLKKELYLPFISQQKAVNQLYITNKTERFSLKVGVPCGL